MVEIKKIATVGGLTLVSRVLGFLRDVLMAAHLGASFAADAFVIAFKLPNFFRRLFAEGAFSAGFIPLYASALTRDQTVSGHSPSTGADFSKTTGEASRFAETILAWFFPVLLVFLGIMEWQMAGVIDLLTGGFSGQPDKQDFTVRLARITFPYLVTISLVALIAGILNSHRRFAAAAFAPVLLNIAMICALLMAPPSERAAALYLSWGVSIAGIAQFIWLYAALYWSGLRLRFRLPVWSPVVSDLLRVIAPAALGAGIMQLNLLLDIILAARYLPEGAVSWLFYADRLNQLTIGVVGVALSTVLLPDLSAKLESGRRREASASLNQALWLGLAVGIPAATGLIILANPIIATLFQRGAFDINITAKTAAALMAYASGLPFYIAVKCFTPAFFAQKDTATPVKIGLIAMAINITANIALIGPLGHVGLALATAISACAQAFLLAFILYRRDLFKPNWYLIGKIAKIIGCSTLMGSFLGALILFSPPIADMTGGKRALWLSGFILPATALYVLSGLITKLVKKSDIKS